MKILILNHRGGITPGGVEQWLIGLVKIARLHADLYLRMDIQEKTIRELRNQVEQIPGLNQLSRIQGRLGKLSRMVRK